MGKNLYIDYDILPEHMRESVKKYLENGRPVGDFLTLWLCNDFIGFFLAADDVNINRAKDYAQFMYSYIPAAAKGSIENVNKWIEKGGLNGLRKSAEHRGSGDREEKD